MAQDDIPGVMGAPGGPGGSRLHLAPKSVIKLQNNGPKPWFKVPKVCPDPKRDDSFISDLGKTSRRSLKSATMVGGTKVCNCIFEGEIKGVVLYF